jgi:hypothetical protein
MARVRSSRSLAATAVCAVVFFLASADRLFTIHALALNIRVANFALLAGIVAWIATRAPDARHDLASLGVAWAPFLSTFGVAAMASSAPVPMAVKLGWFAFSFVAAYAWTSLFDHRDVARGYFLAYVAVAAIIVVDFVSGFTRGPGHMIGFGQANDMVRDVLLFRPSAFYYEPSFAASGLALAWALAMTVMRGAAPRVATALLAMGAVALLVMTSRTGWLFATVAAVALLAFAATLHQQRLIRAVKRAAVPAALAGALLTAAMTLSGQQDVFGDLMDKLGFVQAFERICPRLAERYASDLGCLSKEDRRHFFGEGQPVDPDKTTEGSRLGALRAAVAAIAAHPWLGIGTGRGSDRLIASPAVPNVWLEIGSEGGVLALVTFLFGICWMLYRWRALEPKHRDILIVLVVWFCVAWQFIETFPRLDLWIAFWVALAWVRGETGSDAIVSRSRHERDFGMKGLSPLEVATQ